MIISGLVSNPDSRRSLAPATPISGASSPARTPDRCRSREACEAPLLRRPCYRGVTPNCTLEPNDFGGVSPEGSRPIPVSSTEVAPPYRDRGQTQPKSDSLSSTSPRQPVRPHEQYELQNGIGHNISAASLNGVVSRTKFLNRECIRRPPRARCQPRAHRGHTPARSTQLGSDRQRPLAQEANQTSRTAPPTFPGGASSRIDEFREHVPQA